MAAVVVFDKKPKNANFGIKYQSAKIDGKGVVVSKISIALKHQFTNFLPFWYMIWSANELDLTNCTLDEVTELLGTWTDYPLKITFEKLPSEFTIKYKEDATDFGVRLSRSPYERGAFVDKGDDNSQVILRSFASKDLKKYCIEPDLFYLDRGVHFMTYLGETDVRCSDVDEVKKMMEERFFPRSMTFKVYTLKGNEGRYMETGTRRKRKKAIPKKGVEKIPKMTKGNAKDVVKKTKVELKAVEEDSEKEQVKNGFQRTRRVRKATKYEDTIDDALMAQLLEDDQLYSDEPEIVEKKVAKRKGKKKVKIQMIDEQSEEEYGVENQHAMNRPEKQVQNILARKDRLSKRSTGLHSGKHTIEPFTPTVIEINSDSDAMEDQVCIVKTVVRKFQRGTIVQCPFGIGQVFGWHNDHCIVNFDSGVAYVTPHDLVDVSSTVYCEFTSRLNRGNILFTLGNIGRLNEGSYLNDSIIDFYLSALLENISVETRDKCHVFSTHFYEQYRSTLNLNKQHGNISGRQKNAYGSVSRWTKRINLFQKEFIFFPINEKMHWSLAIVCNINRVPAKSSIKKNACKYCGQSNRTVNHVEPPIVMNGNDDEPAIAADEINEIIVNEVASSSDFEEPVMAVKKTSSSKRTRICYRGPSDLIRKGDFVHQKAKYNCSDECRNKRPCIILLDSTKGHRAQTTAGHIRNYLQQAWDALHANEREKKLFSASSIPVVSPKKIPRQTNSCDCGVFLLQYAELFLRLLPTIDQTFVESQCSHHSVINHNWFSGADIPLKRAQILGLILKLKLVEPRKDLNIE